MRHIRTEDQAIREQQWQRLAVLSLEWGQAAEMNRALHQSLMTLTRLQTVVWFTKDVDSPLLHGLPGWIRALSGRERDTERKLEMLSEEMEELKTALEI